MDSMQYLDFYYSENGTIQVDSLPTTNTPPSKYEPSLDKVRQSHKTKSFFPLFCFS